MKKQINIFLGIMLFLGIFSSSLSAQNLEELLKTVMSSKSKIKTIDVGNFRVKLPNAVGQMCIKESVEGYFDSYNLSRENFPGLSKKNDAHKFQAVQQFAESAVEFKEKYSQIFEEIDGKVYHTEIPYKEYLPKNPGVIYIGEIHSQPRIHNEIIALIKQLPSIYPNKRIYFGTEFLSASRYLPMEANLIYSPQELHKRIEPYEDIVMETILQTALQSNMGVFGMEDVQAVIKASTPRGFNFPTIMQYGDYATSLEGMSFRNEIFASRVKELQKMDPDALIVVYGGLGHMSYHEYASLPTLVGGESFVIQYSVPAALITINPLFSYLRQDPHLRNAFRSSKDAKLVEWWKQNPSSYRHLLGNDLTVIVHQGMRE